MIPPPAWRSERPNLKNNRATIFEFNPPPALSIANIKISVSPSDLRIGKGYYPSLKRGLKQHLCMMIYFSPLHQNSVLLSMTSTMTIEEIEKRTEHLGIQMQPIELFAIAKYIHPPMNILIFGLGNDSIFWYERNNGGRTVFSKIRKNGLMKLKLTTHFLRLTELTMTASAMNGEASLISQNYWCLRLHQN